MVPTVDGANLRLVTLDVYKKQAEQAMAEATQ